MRPLLPLAATLAIAAALAGCKKTPTDPVDAMDKQLVDTAGNAADPALTSALADQIMVDPALAQQSNAKTVRPAPSPATAPIPPGDTTPAPPAPGKAPPIQVAGVASGNCLDVGYGMDWAKRLPAAFPVIPGASVTEAAGSDKNGCTIRIVSFRTQAAIGQVLSFYEGKARAGGYTAERETANGEQTIAGSRGGAAYSVMARASAGGGTEADLVVNGGS